MRNSTHALLRRIASPLLVLLACPLALLAQTTTRSSAGLTKAASRHSPVEPRALKPSGALSGIEDVNDPMEDLGKQLDEYGYITVSTPLLSRPDGRFAFGLDRPAKTYFDEAKTEVQGDAAAFEQKTFSLALQAAMEMSPDAKKAAEEDRARCRELRARADQRMEARRAAAEAQYKADMLHAASEQDPTKRADLEAAAAKARANALDSSSEPDPCPPATKPDDTTDKGSNSQPSRDRNGDATTDVGPPEFTGTGEFTKFQGLLENAKKPTLSNRAAIIQAAGDRAVQAIFNVLGDPGSAQRFADRVTLLGVSTVSVAPGWRTRTGYAADVAVAVELTYTRARPEVAREVIQDLLRSPSDAATVVLALRLGLNHGLTDELGNMVEGPGRTQSFIPDGLLKGMRVNPGKELTAWGLAVGGPAAAKEDAKWEDLAVPSHLQPSPPESGGHLPTDRPVPVVTSVSPMTESQNLDLASSFRSRKSIALALQFVLRSAGMSDSASALAGYTKQMEIDVATRTPDVSVASFGGSHLFGYQVGPQLKAIGNAASRKPKPMMELGRQTFPVLIICGFSREDLRPIVGLEPDDHEATDQNPAKPISKRVLVFEPQLRFTQVPRWVPIDRKHSGGGVNEEDVMDLAERLDAAEPRTANTSGTGAADRAASLADMRVEEMWARAFGSTAAVTLPKELIVDPAAEHTASVDFITPDDVTLISPADKVFTVTAIGSGLTNLSDVTDVSGVVTPSLILGPDPTSQTIRIKVNKKGAGTALLQFFSGVGPLPRLVSAHVLDVREPPPAPKAPTKPPEVASVQVERNANGEPTRITIAAGDDKTKPAVDAGDLVNMVKAALHAVPPRKD